MNDSFLDQATIDRHTSMEDKIFELCKGRDQIHTRSLPAEVASRFGFDMKLQNVRQHVQHLVDNGFLIRIGGPRSGMVADPNATAATEFKPIIPR